MEREENAILTALRREPEQTASLIKFGFGGAGVILAWDVLASLVLPFLVVEAVTAFLVLSFCLVVTFLVARILIASRDSSYMSIRPSMRGASGYGVPRTQETALRGSSSEEVNGLDGKSHGAAGLSTIFNEQYFIMRLQEQVKDARRDGRPMSVAALEITIPGGEAAQADLDRIAYEMARIGALQWKLIGQPLAVSQTEFIFSLPHSTPDEAKLFIREVVQALGEYWCHFGIATFPRNATEAEGLVSKAREACDLSRKDGRPGREPRLSA